MPTSTWSVRNVPASSKTSKPIEATECFTSEHIFAIMIKSLKLVNIFPDMIVNKFGVIVLCINSSHYEGHLG